jgi:predicted GIY-YIG superfamily endonuclease
MNEISYGYILASDFRKLYIGVTSEIEIRIAKHKTNLTPTATRLATTSRSWFISNDSP